MTARSDVLAERLAATRSRIDSACTAYGRSEKPQLIVVTKFFPASDVLALRELGVSAVGENRDQEAKAKHAEVCAALGASGPGVDPLRWHFIGQVQTNKANSVASYADVVHSVDRPALVTALAKGARNAQRTLTALIQVSLDGPDSGQGRAGALIEDVPALADAIAGVDGLELGGIMAVAPLGGDPRAAFARLREVSEHVQSAHPGASVISAGMSGDLEAAIEFGATHLRVGSAILGSRPALR